MQAALCFLFIFSAIFGCYHAVKPIELYEKVWFLALLLTLLKVVLAAFDFHYAIIDIPLSMACAISVGGFAGMILSSFLGDTELEGKRKPEKKESVSIELETELYLRNTH